MTLGVMLLLVGRQSLADVQVEAAPPASAMPCHGKRPFRIIRTRTTIALGESMAELKNGEREPLYCPTCEAEVSDPLVCGDCGTVICRKCGTPLEKIDELGIG